MAALEAPITAWLNIPTPVFDAPVEYRIVGGRSWTVAHVAVIELGEDRYGMLICHVYECGLAPNPTTAQVGLVLNENVVTSADGRQMALTMHIMKGPTLVSLLPVNEPGMVVILRFTERKEYLACLKAMNDAEIACLDKQDEMKLTLRHGLSTTIPRHSDPSGPEVVCEMHRDVPPPVVNNPESEEEEVE